MLSRLARGLPLARTSISRSVGISSLQRGSFRYYSEKAPSEEPHEEEEHDKEGFPISESESIFNRYTGTFFGTVFVIIGYQYLNSQYQTSHDGEPLLSLLKWGDSLDDLKANFDSYRDAVAKNEELHAMMANTVVRDSSNVVTRIRDVPGRVQCFSGNSQFNTIQDWSEVGPRKQIENPYH
ncbi:DEKNAAC101636 [Brettanomyces naardenensis]|uniref:DEKNAAC101636 n=1 Tax=Brettanomyces naardenensis TaxID=13370 RepID=A0A448YID7_BRENA|nr:DEKNAAC101636 [Brettanomyces naardenensis]